MYRKGNGTPRYKNVVVLEETKGTKKIKKGKKRFRKSVADK